MAHLRIQHTMQGYSNLPEDRYINVFHLRTPAVVTTGDLDTVCQLIAAFYDSDPAGSPAPVAHYLNTGSDATGRSVKIYDMADPMPRAPIRQLAATSVGWDASGNNLPEELAVCLSYRADPDSGVPAARLRGRIYIGPLSGNAMTSGSNLIQAEPFAGFRDTLLAAGKELKDGLDAIDYQWCVWSGAGNLLHTITQLSVDDAFDIQRRRGHAPTFRTVLAV